MPSTKSVMIERGVEEATVKEEVAKKEKAVIDTGRAERVAVPVRSEGAYRGKTVWIDIDNSPHVPFFLPIIEELEKHGIELVLTARDMYQVCELLAYFHLPCKVMGTSFRQEQAAQGQLSTACAPPQLCPSRH